MTQESTDTPSRPRPAVWAVALAFGLVYLTWGTTYLAIRKGVHDEALPPALFAGSRVCLAGLILLAFAGLSGHSVLLPRRDLGIVAVTGCVLFVCGNGLINFGERTVPSGVAAVLTATMPLFVGLLSMFSKGGERLSGRGWLGLFVGLGGVAVLLAPKLGDPAAFFRDTGPLLVLGSSVSWALGSVLVRHHRVSGSHLTAAAYQMAIGGGCLALLGVAAGERVPEQLTPGAIGSFLYLLVFGSLVGFVAYNWLLGHVTAAKVSTYSYVNPVIAVLIAWAAGEEMTEWIAAGITVILAGVALVRSGGAHGPAAEMPDAEETPAVATAPPLEPDAPQPCGERNWG